MIVKRGDGTESAYWHLSKVLVAKGDHVTRGDVIGKSGATGWVCGAHLHFQMERVPADRSSPHSAAIKDVFHDRDGEPFDPEAGTRPMSRNGILDIP